MTGKNRVKLGAYFLFALLLFSIPVSFWLAHWEAKRQQPYWRATETGYEFVDTAQREQAIAFVRHRYGLSRRGAEQFIAREERRTGMRVGSGHVLPYGALVDYYTVDGTKFPNTARYEGTAAVVHPNSLAARAYMNYVREQAKKENRPEWLNALEAMLKKNIMLIPTAWSLTSGVSAASDAAKAALKANTTNYRIAVICTILPGFRDISPRSDGDNDANDTGQLFVDYNTRTPSATPTEVCYRQVPPVAQNVGLVYNFATVDFSALPLNIRLALQAMGLEYTENPPGTDLPYPESVFDSPGGVFNASGNWGIPYGVPGGWDYTQEAMAPHASHATNLLLQNSMYDFFFDEAFSAVSVSNWFYQQTRGAVKITGTTNDIIGWLRSAHQLNRYPYQIGGGNILFVLPGTPLIRHGMGGTPSPASGYNWTQNQIVRATLSSRGCTILFSHPLAMPGASDAYNSAIRSLYGDFNINNLTIQAYTEADTSEDNGTQPGTVTILWNQSTYSVVQDPYDARRWTITNPGGTGWRFMQADTQNPPSPTYTSFTAYNGGSWTLTYTGFNYINGNINQVRNAQMRGCPPLDNTTLTAADMRISLYNHGPLNEGNGYPAWGTNPAPSNNTSTTFDQRPFARLKSMHYYTRSHSGPSSGTYQIAHLNNEWGYPDDISGTAVSERAARPKPFDTGPNDVWNGGYWPTGATVREGSSGEYAGDVNRVLEDNGITLSGYQVRVYIAADGGAPTPGGSENMVVAGFQPSSSLTNINESGVGVVFHELCHALLFATDLYDNDLYANRTIPPPVPQFHECAAMGPYSVMDSGGRLDAWHLQRLLPGWGLTPVQAITQDTLGFQFPAVEGMLRDPVIAKLPANPYYIKRYLQDPVANSPDTWEEYFLVENRNVNSSDGNGAYGFDSSPKGLYIYHVDMRSPALNNPNQAGFQRDDDILSVIIEQADGLRELHYNNKGNPGNMQTDPFGANTATRVTRFWQFPMFNGDVNDFGQLVQNVGPGGSPTSYSHGYTYRELNGGSNVLIPGTETDSFTRIVKISNIGPVMTADLYVEPAELVPEFTGNAASLITSQTANIASIVRSAGPNNLVTVTTTAAHGFNCGESVSISGVADNSLNGVFTIQCDPSQPNVFTFRQTNQDPVSLGAGGTAQSGIVQQGQQNVGFLRLTLQNPDGRSPAGLADYTKMSIKDVYLERLYVLQSGAGSSPTDIAAAKLYLDSNANGLFEPDIDTLLQSVTVDNSGQWTKFAVFGRPTGLGFKIPLGETKTFFIAYDIAPEAQINPKISVGAEFTDSQKIEPRLPGVVQVRKRNNAPFAFDRNNFPIFSNTATVVGFPDRLVITGDTTNMPTQASQGQANLPMLKLNCAVNPGGVPRTLGSVRINSIKVDQIGTANALADLVNCRLYLDNGDGVFDASTDTALGTSSFTVVGGLQQATFPNLNLQINAGTPLTLFLTVTLAPSADTTKNIQLSVKFTTPGPQPQDTCYVQLINNVTEADPNKDYVEWQAPDASWPINSLVVNVILPNTPPNPPQAPFSPSGGQQISDNTPTLSWGAASDPDAADTPDKLRYEIQLADNASFNNPLSAVTGQGVTSYDVTTALTFDQDYWWRVRTIDPQDATSAWSATQQFRVVTNRPPAQITSGFSPAFTTVNTLTPLIQWDKSTDPDASDPQNTLSYQLQVDDNNDFSSVLINVTTPEDQNWYNVQAADGLQWGVRYFYRVRAMDRAGAQSPWSAPIVWFRPVENRAPEVPIAPYVPSGGAIVTTANPVLQWQMPAPPDPDPSDTIDTIHYEVQLKKDDGDFTSGTIIEYVTAVGVQQWAVTQDKDGNPVNLEDNGHYFWRVRAVDQQGATSDWTTVQNFYVNTANQAPLPPDANFDPANGRSVSSQTPLIQWGYGSDPDPGDTPQTLYYILQLSKQANFSTVAYTYTTAENVRQVTPTTPLSDLTQWYWRVRAVDRQGARSAWSEVQNFYVNTNNQQPTLSNPQVTPLHGALDTYFELYVTYTDPENDLPTSVQVVFDNGVGPLEMRKVNPADNDATNGIQYVVGIAGHQLGLGAHGHAFLCDGGVRLPAILTDFLRGPVLGTPSAIRFTNAAGVGRTQYEEGANIWVEVTDADENLDPAVRETVQVTITAPNGESETVTLTETAANTGLFRGSIPSRGRAGAPDDGVLNVIAGASGATITATYTDKDDYDNPTPDTVNATAQVVDTTPPGGVNAVLVLQSGPHGRTMDLDWTAYDENAQVDVAGYHVWMHTTNFTSTAGMTPVVTLPAGTKSFTVTGLNPNTNYWFAVTAFDEVPLERTNVTPVKGRTLDTSAPTIAGQSPAPGTTEVPLDTELTFLLDDPGVGVNQSTLCVTVLQNGQTVPLQAPTFTGDQYSLQVTVKPAQPLKWNAAIAVTVDVQDFDGNRLLVTNWNFATVTDNELPTIDEQSPAPGATNVPVTSSLSFALHDTDSGIDTSRVQVLLDGQDVSADLLFTPIAGGVRVRYNPPADLQYSQQYTVAVTAADVAGNVLGPVQWTFTTVQDATGVGIDQFNPARGAVNVPIDTNISFRLSDTQAGIKGNSFRLWVAGEEVTGSPDLTIVKNPADAANPTTMLVTYNPPQDLPYSTVVEVRIYVEDVVGNVTDLTYNFTTIAEPTYVLRGFVKDPNDNPLVGVQVTAVHQGGRNATGSATTDGYGAYRITGLVAGPYLVTPSKAEYDFEPPSANVVLGPNDGTADFVGTLRTYSLSGRITEGGVGLAGVQVACFGQTATTDYNGNYLLAGIPSGTHTVTPSLANYHFQPPSRTVQVASANVTGVDFEAVADTFTISGTIKDSVGNRLRGVQVVCGDKSVVTDAQGQYLVSGLRAGSYTLTPSKAGYIFSPAQQEIAIPPSATQVDFTAYYDMTAEFPAGLNLIGVPGVPTDNNPLNVFQLNPAQNEQAYRYNPAGVPPRYLVASSDWPAEPLQVKPGRGFFVRFSQPKTLHIPGNPTGSGQVVNVGLNEGWNMIANPRSTPLKFNQIVPSIPGGIRPFAFVYDNSTNSYLMVAASGTLGAVRNQLLGWEGAWVRATSGGVSLALGAVGSAAAEEEEESQQPKQADLQGGWIIPIQVRAGKCADLTSLAGVVPGAGAQHTVENPPMLPNSVDLYFINDSGVRLAHDVRSELKAQIFNFVVACEIPNAQVTLTLPDLSTVPADMQVLLVDKQTGRTMYARTMNGYTYRSEGERSERAFQLIVEPRRIGALSVSATAAQTRADLVTLNYTVTKACQVTVRVLNMAGRCIRTLVSDKVVAAGQQQELWNLNAANGTLVPAGTYLLQIEAVCDNGQRVQSMTTVRVTR